MAQFGIELEVSENANCLLTQLHKQELTEHTYFHKYHCTCEDCDVFSTRLPPFLAQEDSTADGEIISRVLQYGTSRSKRAISGLAQAILGANTVHDGNVGLHVHVSHEDMDSVQCKRLERMFCLYQDELMLLAGGPRHIRNYNDPLDQRAWIEGLRPGKTSTYLAKRSETYEFRIWNSVKTEWRLRLAIGLSIAMVQGARDEVLLPRRLPVTDMLADRIGHLFDAHTWAGYIAQHEFDSDSGFHSRGIVGTEIDTLEEVGI